MKSPNTSTKNFTFEYVPKESYIAIRISYEVDGKIQVYDYGWPKSEISKEEKDVIEKMIKEIVEDQWQKLSQ